MGELLSFPGAEIEPPFQDKVVLKIPEAFVARQDVHVNLIKQEHGNAMTVIYAGPTIAGGTGVVSTGYLFTNEKGWETTGALSFPAVPGPS